MDEQPQTYQYGDEIEITEEIWEAIRCHVKAMDAARGLANLAAQQLQQASLDMFEELRHALPGLAPRQFRIEWITNRIVVGALDPPAAKLMRDRLRNSYEEDHPQDEPEPSE